MPSNSLRRKISALQIRGAMKLVIQTDNSIFGFAHTSEKSSERVNTVSGTQAHFYSIRSRNREIEISPQTASNIAKDFTA